MINHLKKYQPIGCRDKKTYNKLLKKGIKAYFSGCITTTLDIHYYQKENSRGKEILFTDFTFGYFPKADIFIKNLKAYDFANVTYLSHGFSSNYSQIERFKIADKILKRYAKARLVITTKIHAALPCLALKTPVILVNNQYDNERFDGLYDLLNTIGINSTNKFEINININDSGLVYNSDKYLKYSSKLKKIMKNYIKE